MLDTKVGQSKKDDPVDVAKIGFDAMMAGKGDVVSEFMNKVQVAMSGVISADRLAEQSRKTNQPGSGKNN